MPVPAAAGAIGRACSAEGVGRPDGVSGAACMFGATPAGGGEMDGAPCAAGGGATAGPGTIGGRPCVGGGEGEGAPCAAGGGATG